MRKNERYNRGGRKEGDGGEGRMRGILVEVEERKEVERKEGRMRNVKEVEERVDEDGGIKYFGIPERGGKRRKGRKKGNERGRKRVYGRRKGEERRERESDVNQGCMGRGEGRGKKREGKEEDGRGYRVEGGKKGGKEGER